MMTTFVAPETILAIFMEPANWQYGRDDRPGGDDDYPVNKPLRGSKL